MTNPYFTGFQQQKLPMGKDEVLMVARLDGPSEAIVRRIIDDSLATETGGCRAPLISMRAGRNRISRIISKGMLFTITLCIWRPSGSSPAGKMKTVVNDKAELFQAW